MSIKISEINNLFVSDQELGLFWDEQEQPSPKVLKVSSALLAPLSSPPSDFTSRIVTIEHPATATFSETSVAEKSDPDDEDFLSLLRTTSNRELEQPSPKFSMSSSALLSSVSSSSTDSSSTSAAVPSEMSVAEERDPFDEDFLALLQSFPQSDYPKATNSMYGRVMLTKYKVSEACARKKCKKLMADPEKLKQKTSWKLTPSISEKFLEFYHRKDGRTDRERNKKVLEIYETVKANNPDARSENLFHEAISKEFDLSRGASYFAVKRALDERKKMDPADVEVEQYLAPDDDSKVAKVQEHFDVRAAELASIDLTKFEEDFILLLQTFPKSEYPLITNRLCSDAMNTEYRVNSCTLSDKYKELIKDEETLKQKPKRELSETISKKFLELYQSKELGIKNRSTKSRDMEIEKEYRRLRELKPKATDSALHTEIGKKYKLTGAATDQAIRRALGKKRKR